MDKYGLAIYNENRVKKRLSTYLDCGGLASVIFPTMKPLDADKKASKTSEAAPAAKVAERVDFSNVKIEPIFEEMVDFDTFAKRREHITYQDDMPLSQSIFQASKRFSKLPMISR